MSPTVNPISVKSILTGSSVSLSAEIGIIIITLVFVLLVQREFMRSSQNPLATRWIRVLNIAILPLLWAAGQVIFLRFIALVQVF